MTAPRFEPSPADATHPIDGFPIEGPAPAKLTYGLFGSVACMMAVPLLVAIGSNLTDVTPRWVLYGVIHGLPWLGLLCVWRATEKWRWVLVAAHLALIGYQGHLSTRSGDRSYTVSVSHGNVRPYRVVDFGPYGRTVQYFGRPSEVLQ